jgi:diguanylate cyclase (GGDEF)-like protein
MPRTRANDTQISTLRDLAEGSAWTEGEQLRIAFESLTQALAASIFCAFVVVALLWPVANAPALILWLGSLSTLTLLRLMMQQQYQRADRNPAIFISWKRGYTGATFLAGVVWGCLAVFAFPTDSIVHQAYLAIVLSGISAGAVSTYAPIPRAFPFFVIPTLAPLAIQMIIHNETHGMIMALLVLTFMLALIRSARDSRNNVVNLLRLQVKNADLTRALHHRATHDSLVNLVNHGEFNRRLQKLTCDKLRVDDDYSLIFIDLDMFKEVNDSGGHAAGDKILRGVGEIIQRNTRGDDTAARVGGDEFAAIMEGCPKRRALEVAETIRRDIANLRIEHEGRFYSVKASIGVSYGMVGEHTASSMLKAADAACYAAKNEGRNRVRDNQADEGYQTTDRFELTQNIDMHAHQGA